MHNYIIYDACGNVINRIYASEQFIVQYCEPFGYSYEQEIDHENPCEAYDPYSDTEEILLELAADHEARLCAIELGV